VASSSPEPRNPSGINSPHVETIHVVP